MPPAATPSFLQRAGRSCQHGANAATKLYRIMDNLEHILSIELMNAAQVSTSAVRQRLLPFWERFLNEYRKEVPFVKEDIVMYKEIHKTVAFSTGQSLLLGTSQ